ncbi:MIF4G domain-containing protein A isoform X1 [Tachysurus fulvidraco]|uniref:MIF4G domain-containing protein A isoform X1 n=1 Tax=Tachysurus fulvidraco TaxID=1234273 RepID=UPI001FEFE363|nr:MIF4G domain-containing protein A isoform X1 [Tachysurus fulvidraco]XP_047670376.1 MIF4G domain-containing protein A isoform X1 [Tachysurus fulvidraco]
MEHTEDWKIQALNTETQQMLKTALTDPGTVDLVKLCDMIVDQALKDSSLCRDAGHVCCTLVQVSSSSDYSVPCVRQVEAKCSSTSVFRRNMLTRLQQEFMRREATRQRSLHEWVCVVSLLCNIFDNLKVNNSPMAALVDPVYDCLFRLAQADALVNEVEVDCLALQLHRLGEQLEKLNTRRMDELFFLLRDGFLLQDDLSSMSRLLLLELLECRAARWNLSKNAQRYYYYSEVVE